MDWLNDGGKGYLMGLSQGGIPYAAPGIVVHERRLIGTVRGQPAAVSLGYAAHSVQANRPETAPVYPSINAGRRSTWASPRPRTSPMNPFIF